MNKSFFDYLMRYGLLALAVVTFALQLFYPPARAYLRFVSVVCIILAPLHGKTFIHCEDVRGWAFQNAALLGHAAVLILNGVIG